MLQLLSRLQHSRYDTSQRRLRLPEPGCITGNADPPRPSNVIFLFPYRTSQSGLPSLIQRADEGWHGDPVGDTGDTGDLGSGSGNSFPAPRTDAVGPCSSKFWPSTFRPSPAAILRAAARPLSDSLEVGSNGLDGYGGYMTEKWGFLCSAVGDDVAIVSHDEIKWPAWLLVTRGSENRLCDRFPSSDHVLCRKLGTRSPLLFRINNHYQEPVSWRCIDRSPRT